MNEHERRQIATHESGHTVVAHHLKDSDAIHKVTILSRGDALGMLTQMPDEDRFTASRKRLMGELAVLFGGRMAEATVCGEDEVCTGAANDLQRASQLARRMVTEFGFGPNGDRSIRYRAYPDGDQAALPDDVLTRIDQDVDAIIQEAKEIAHKIVAGHKSELEALIAKLLERDTLTKTEIEAVLGPSDQALGLEFPPRGGIFLAENLQRAKKDSGGEMPIARRPRRRMRGRGPRPRPCAHRHHLAMIPRWISSLYSRRYA